VDTYLSVTLGRMQMNKVEAANLRLFLFYGQPGTLVPHKVGNNDT